MAVVVGKERNVHYNMGYDRMHPLLFRPEENVLRHFFLASDLSHPFSSPAAASAVVVVIIIVQFIVGSVSSLDSICCLWAMIQDHLWRERPDFWAIKFLAWVNN